VEELWRLVGWRRLVVTGLCLVVWRALEQITVVGVNPVVIGDRLQAVDTTSLFHAIGSGIPLASLSIVAMGIGPYVNALIIMWLLQLISSRLRSIGSTDDGRLRLLRWTRALTVVLALGQAYGWTVLWQAGFPPALPPMEWFSRLVLMIELTGGTMILVWVADLLDEVGLGFGNGAILIYALTPLALEAHRLADTFATAPSVEALYLSFSIWLAFSIGVVALTVAMLTGIRRVSVPGRNQAKAPNPVELQLLMSGVLRPPMFVQAVLFLPFIVANYTAASNPDLGLWIADHVTAYGTNPWTNIAYVAVDAFLMIGATYFVVGADFRLRAGLSQTLIGHINRLTFIGGTFLALTVVVLPVLEWNVSRATGRGFPMSGYDAVLVVVMVLAIVGTLERAANIRSLLPVPISYLP
jgi:preprotein translocase subunit SecY